MTLTKTFDENTWMTLELQFGCLNQAEICLRRQQTFMSPDTEHHKKCGSVRVISSLPLYCIHNNQSSLEAYIVVPEVIRCLRVYTVFRVYQVSQSL
jgi:hypothetical protein